MVLEVFAALSLTASIVQFIDFGGKLFSKAKELHHSRDGYLRDHADLDSATKSLKGLICNISSSTSTTANTAENISDDEKALMILARDCTELADELVRLLERVKGVGQRDRWSSFLQAIRIVWNEKEIDHTKEKLKDFQARTALHVLAILK